MFAMLVLQEAGPNTELAWLFYLFLAFFLLMVIVGWLTSRRGGNQTESTPEMHFRGDTEDHSMHEGSEHPM